MKKFMMIFIGSEYEDLGLSPEQTQQRMGNWFTWHEKLEKEGRVVSGEALQPQITRIEGADKTVTDNVAIESKELIGGFYVFKAKDLDDAKEVAKDYPDYDLGGTVQLREIMVFDDM